MTSGNGSPRGPVVPRSQEELEQERLDREEDAATAARERQAMLGRAHHSARMLAYASLLCSAGASVLAWVLAPGPTAWGVTLGSLVMTANLVALSVLLGKVLLEEENRAFFGMLLLGSFLALAGVSAWVVRSHQDMALGYGLGLSVPALAGMVFGLFRRGRSVG
ncbi:MAG: hypothetical protein HY904_11090 [Deltaproteobacteria bacterium]|nr:hypothetical protein [Deltaproteobacteria bacterium]